MDILDWLRSETARFWAAIVVGIGIGLAGAYGKERHDGRKPDRHWLFNRLLIYPFLGLAAATAAESFGFSLSRTAFAASVLSLVAFDFVRVISTRFLRRTESAVDAVIAAADGGAVLNIPGGADMPSSVGIALPPQPKASDFPRRAELRSAYPAPGQHDPEMDALIEKLDKTEWRDPNA